MQLKKKKATEPLLGFLYKDSLGQTYLVPLHPPPAAIYLEKWLKKFSFHFSE